MSSPSVSSTQGVSRDHAGSPDRAVRPDHAVRPAHGVLAVTLVAFVGHLLLALRVDGPFMFHDEGSYVALSRLLDGGSVELFGPRYAPGLGLLLYPAQALLDPGGLHRAGQVLDAVAAAAMVPVLYLIARRIGRLSPWFSLGAAAAGASSAALVLQSVMLIPESAFTLVATSVPLVLFFTMQRPSPARGFALGALAGSAYVLHTRGLSVVAATVVVVLVSVVDRRLPTRVAVAVATGMAAIALPARAVQAWAIDELYPLGSFGKDAGSLLALVQSPVAVAQTAVGHAWYLVFASLGLGVLGLVGAGHRAWDGRRTAEGDVGLHVVLAVGAGLVLSAVALHRTGIESPDRADKAVYGRYVETWLPLLVTLAPTIHRRLLRPTVAVTAVASGVAGVVLYLGYDGSVWTRSVAWHNVSALRILDVGFEQFLVVRAALALVVVIPLLFLGVMRRGGARPWAIPLVAMAAMNLVAGSDGVTNWAAIGGEQWSESHALGEVIDEVAETPGVEVDETRVGISVETGAPILYLYNLQFWHPEVDVDIFFGTDTRSASLQIASANAPPDVPFRELLAIEDIGGLALWVVDADLASTLRGAGWTFLEPPG